MPVSVAGIDANPAMRSTLLADARQSTRSGFDVSSGSPRTRVRTAISREASANGSGLRRTPLTTLNIVVVPPMPTASTATTSAEKTGALRRTRSA
jgi:hypothetical protein